MIKKNKFDLDNLYQILWARAYSYSLDIALEHNLFLHLKRCRGNTLNQVSSFLKMPLMSTRIVLQYLCGLELLVKKEDKFVNSKLANHYLTDADFSNDLKVFSSETFEEFKNRLYHPKTQPWYDIKENNNSLENVKRISSDFFISDSQHEWRIQKGSELADYFNFEKYNFLVDLGGASGGWSMGIRKNNSHLECVIFDLPEVCEMGKKVLSKSGNDSMITYREGDIFNNPNYPPEADIFLIANVLHDWCIDDIKEILKGVYNSYAKVTVLVSELFINDNWKGPLSNIIQSIFVLGPDEKSGWQPTYKEMEEILLEIGFKNLRRHQNLLVCEKK